MKAELLSRIQDRSATVGVVGLGYVGLPLAMEFAKAGFHVIGYDVSDRVCKLLMSGQSHIQDVPAAEVASMLKNGLFEATTDESALGRCDAISIAVPTPLSKTRDPDMKYVQAATEAIARNAHPRDARRAREHDVPRYDARSHAAQARGARAHGR